MQVNSQYVPRKPRTTIEIPDHIPLGRFIGTGGRNIKSFGGWVNSSTRELIVNEDLLLEAQIYIASFKRPESDTRVIMERYVDNIHITMTSTRTQFCYLVKGPKDQLYEYYEQILVTYPTNPYGTCISLEGDNFIKIYRSTTSE